jgi:hypothetical protein
LADTDENESLTSYDCEICQAKDLMGKRSGRICLLYQIDFLNEDSLTYRSLTRLGEVSGIVNSEEEFYESVDKLLDAHKTERLEVALRFYRIGNINGICPKSFPRTQLSTNLMSIINLCVGGESGTDIQNFPSYGGILEQSNLFIEAYYIWRQEHTSFIKYLKVKAKSAPPRQ